MAAEQQLKPGEPVPKPHAKQPLVHGQEATRAPRWRYADGRILPSQLSWWSTSTVGSAASERIGRKSVAPIAAVQNRFSPLEQTDRPVVDICAKTGIAYLAYNPLGGRASALAEAFPAAADLAARKGVSMPRLALAWLLTVSPTLIPITGASRPESIRDSALAADLQLTEDELSRLDFAPQAAGPQR